MKKLYTILLLATSLFTTSCSDWLDVAPSNQVNGDKLFEVGDGYRNALNGIYLNLGTSSMYGRTMSWGFMDAIAQYYQQIIILYLKIQLIINRLSSNLMIRM